MADKREDASPTRAQAVPSTRLSSRNRGRDSTAESDSRAASIARLTSPIASVGSPANQAAQQSSQSNQPSEQGPLAGEGAPPLMPGPGQSALAAAFRGSLGSSPPRFGTPPTRQLSPPPAPLGPLGSGPPTTFGSLDSRSGPAGGRRISGAPGVDLEVVKRHLVLPQSTDGTVEGNRSLGKRSERPSLQNIRQGDGTASEVDHDEFSSLQREGGDTTRDVYRWQQKAESSMQGVQAKRSKSFIEPRPEPEEPTMDVNSITVPGGFRRDHLRRRAESPAVHIGQGTESQDFAPRNSNAANTPRGILTNSFMEFVSSYGHFAGQDFADDDEDDYFGTESRSNRGQPDEDGIEHDQEPTEGSPLLTPGTPGHRRRRIKTSGPSGTNSPTGAAVLLLKGFVGTGVLFLPKAYLNGGMLFSNLVLLGVAGLSYYCFILLVNTRLKVGGSFGDMGRVLYGKWLYALIQFSLVLSQVGFVSAYIVFTSENLQAFVLAISKCRTWIDIKLMVLMQLIIFLPLSLFRDINKLGGLAIVAEILIVLGLGYLGYYDIDVIIKNGGASDITNFNANHWTLFIGTAIFTFEGVGLIIPIQEGMRDPAKFPPVLAGVMVVITVVFITIGALSYAAFGSQTKTVILLNLDQENKFVNATQLLYSLAILLSTPLQFFPAIRIMELEFFSRSGKFNRYIKWKKNAFRFVVVIGCALLAWGGAGDLDKFVALVGSFACVPLVYIYPVSLLTDLSRHSERSRIQADRQLQALLHLRGVATTRRQRIADIVLCVLGLVAMLYTTIQTIRTWAGGSVQRKPPGYCDD